MPLSASRAISDLPSSSRILSDLPFARVTGSRLEIGDVFLLAENDDFLSQEDLLNNLILLETANIIFEPLTVRLDTY